uniref:Lon N-terminal domain-containing protein n=1 Tax=Steinernema glaseri TaxID=37863 RepID=A0A1I7ZH71_9BILA
MYDRIAQLVGGRGKDVSFTFEQMKKAFHTNGVAQTAQLLVLPSFLFPLDGLSEEEARVVRSRQERFILRVQLAMEEGLQWMKDIPKEKIE